jgi:hypothetical protein
MRVLQVRGRLDLSQEAFGSYQRREFGLQDLDRDFTLVTEVVGKVDVGHPAFAELSVDGITAFKGSV